MMETEALLRVQNLEKVFPIKGGFFSKKRGSVHAISNVSFEVHTGETLGLVGESGCGKTTIGLCILRLIDSTGGRVFFKDQDVFALDQKKLQVLRSQMQMIFQDPFASLDPQWNVGRIVGEGLGVHGIAAGGERSDRIEAMLGKVGLNPDSISRYPGEFSGGQRQRIGIARALILEPKLVIGDEPLSALDVSIQAQVINLLTELQKEYGFTYLMISHDLSVVKYVSDRIAVMYLGKLVEVARSADIYSVASHPYTRALLSAVPVPDPRVKKDRVLLKGEIPSPVAPPPGCRFHSRCPVRIDICDQEEPVLKEIGPSHYCACHLL